MIQYRDWYIWTQGQVVARQFDHKTRSLEVVGQLPEGWDWTAIVRVGEYMDYLPLARTDTGAAIVLSAQQLALSGRYSIQLRGTQGELVRHTNVLSVYVPASLSGDTHWPELPGTFTALEQRVSRDAQLAGQAAAQAQEEVARAQEAARQAQETVQQVQEKMYRKFELVETITTGEDLTAISRTAWPDGTPYSFKEMLVKCELQAGTGTGQLNMQFQNRENPANYVTLATTSTNAIATTKRYHWTHCYERYGFWNAQHGTASTIYASTVNQMTGYDAVIRDLPIDSLVITATTTGVPIPAGSIIKIYGVRE